MTKLSAGLGANTPLARCQQAGLTSNIPDRAAKLHHPRLREIRTGEGTELERGQRFTGLADPELVIGVTPFEEPNAHLAVALARAGALGVLDLGRDTGRARAALADACRWWRGGFGVRAPAGCGVQPADLPDRVDTVIHALGCAWELGAAGERRTFVEVNTVAEGRTAVRAGAYGLIAKGSEAGGRVGTVTTFVLLQQLLADPEVRVPVWAAGGIGLHTAAAALAGGAAGVVLDAQLALVSEADLPAEVAAAIRAMDGSETAVVGGHRVYVRPDLPIVALLEAGDADPETVAARLGAHDLRSQFLPIGQDGALAGPLAEQYVTAGGVVAAIRASITTQLRTALAPARGVPHLVAQGPMTRVSDQAAFAAAVAEADGLPFLALALMTGSETRALLEETAARLADRPWGVGILGFVPPQVREAQLAVVHDVHPPYALIAGGRPAQAASLEAAGIETFLHVPSPGLLDRFLADGTRRFVFEGRECGGHVGPRASFPLWDIQVQRLLLYGARHGSGFFDELQVLFAGGIHDERSAAMVAALAAPLSERGVSVGVLMGTAYLFTEEAVAAGAIQPGFQQSALACEATVLLETAPGHATRCVDSPYVRTFTGTKARLAADGVPVEDMWAELERLNLGRLRIASKGLRREDGHLTSVDGETQRRDGMFMIGDVAMLRSATTTVAALHAQVTDGAAGFLAARVEQLGVGRAPSVDHQPAEPLDVAIIGMAGVFPGASDLASYWANVVAGIDGITEVPAERWDVGVYYDPGGRQGTPSKWGGFLPDVPFDALAYGIPPAALASIEPVQLLALEVAARAIADAGYAERAFDRERTAVIFGAEGGAELDNVSKFRALYPAYIAALPPALDEQLPALTEDSFPGVLANVIAGRIANRLDLGGANYTVDAACASSLAALDLACKELRAGSADMVLAGGADTHNGIYDYLLFASAQALSPTGRCRPFDSSADGIALGEGVACVALKRLADAERDGDRIYAVIKGVGSSSDGRSLGLTAPRPEGQRRALERAYRMAGVSPAEVGLVEAHGTGTVVGDRTELGTLTELFAEAGAGVGSCALGSVKSQVGHTKCAAGLAGLIKAARAVHAGVRPPTRQLAAPNPYWDRQSSPFCFNQAARPWISGSQRVAGLSAFGFGGTNFHAVLTSYDGAPEPRHGLEEWPAELFLFAGADRAAAVAEMDRLAELLAASDAAGRPWRLRDLARTVSDRPVGTGQRVWAAVVADDLDDLAAKLDRARTFAPEPKDGVFVAKEVATGEVAFLFPGQGSQRPGMLSDLYVAFPRLRRFLGQRWADATFPPAAFSNEESARQREALTDTRVAQPALGVAGLTMHHLLTSLGVRPDHAGGHSYGELVALATAGAIDTTELLDLSEARAEAILASAGEDPGAMAAVAKSPDQVRAALACDERFASVVVANHNAPAQTVVSGPTAAIVALAEAGLTGKRLPVACAFHSPVVAGAAGLLAAELGSRTIASPEFPVWSNTTAAPYPNDPAAIRATLAAQVAEPVRFVDQIEAMYAAGVRVFVEAGPGQVLTGLVGKILRDCPHVAVATDAPGEHGLRRLLLALAELATAGVPIDPTALFQGRDAEVVSAAAVPQRAGWLVNGQLIRTADGRYLPGGLRPAQAVPLAYPVPTANGERDAAVLEFLRGNRELVAAQREVLLSYLGTPARALSTLPPALPPVGGGTVIAGQALEPAIVGMAEQPAGVAEQGDLTPDQIMAAVVAVVSERTGYPQDMLDPDLDLEADLSIDSIKRAEILAELADRFGQAAPGVAPGESVLEELAGLRTLRGIVDWVTQRTGVPAGTVPAGPRAQRYLVDIAPLLPVSPATGSFAGRCVAVVEDGLGIGLELSVLLEQRGAEVRLSTPDRPGVLGDADTLIDLTATDPGRPPVLPTRFATLREAVLGGVAQLMVVTGSGGRFGHDRNGNDAIAGIGLPGLVRTIGHEYPDLRVHAVDVDPKDDPACIAGHLLTELDTPDAPVVVGYAAGERATLRLVPAPLERPAAAPELGLDPDSVVLLTGGARGITAKVAIGLARASGCHVELVGRTPLPVGDEEPTTASAGDRVALRRALIETGIRVPAEVEATSTRLLTQREIRATLAELTGCAASVRYHALDVRNRAAVRAVLDDLYARHGRLDGIVHGAGVLDDRLLRDKTLEEFTRVWATKVDGAWALAEAARTDLSFLVLFGSVSGVFGNRGQSDYAAANDALDALARSWAGRFKGRVVTVDWGPWAAGPESGMVSAELQREYARRGIEVIEHDDGVACLLAELAWGGQAQVVYMCGNPAAFEAGTTGGTDG